MTEEVKEPELSPAEKKAKDKEMIKKIRKQNPGVKVKRTPGGGFQISNPRTPSSLLTNLIKRLEK